MAMVKALADSGVGFYLQSLETRKQTEHAEGVDAELEKKLAEFEEV
jgi:hypothetical protein